MPKYGLGLETILVPWLYSCTGGQSRLRVTHCICLYQDVPRAAASRAVQNCCPFSLLFPHPMIIHLFLRLIKKPPSPSRDARGKATQMQGLLYSPRKQTLRICAAARPHKVVDMLSGLRLQRKWTQATTAQNNEHCAYQSSLSNLWLSFKRSLNFDWCAAPAKVGKRPAPARVVALAAMLPWE